MIVLSKTAKDYLNSVERSKLVDGMEMGESQLSATINGTVEPSKNFIEKFLTYSNMDFEKAFTIVEEERDDA